jgi:hypothetical protein
MQTANQEWCISHVNESLVTEREAARDPDARHRAEQQARRSEAQFNWQISLSPEYFSHDREGFSEPYVGFREPGYHTGYTKNRYSFQVAMLTIDIRSMRMNTQHTLVHAAIRTHMSGVRKGSNSNLTEAIVIVRLYMLVTHPASHHLAQFQGVVEFQTAHHQAGGQ